MTAKLKTKYLKRKTQTKRFVINLPANLVDDIEDLQQRAAELGFDLDLSMAVYDALQKVRNHVEPEIEAAEKEKAASEAKKATDAAKAADANPTNGKPVDGGDGNLASASGKPDGNQRSASDRSAVRSGLADRSRFSGSPGDSRF